MFLNWLVSHLPHMISLAGAVGIGLSDLGAAETETPAETTTTEITPVEGLEGVDTTTPQEEVTEQQPTEETKIDWRTVPKDVKDHIQEIAKTNKALANRIQNAVYTSQSMLKEFPGGLKEAQALKNTVEEFGGLEGVKNIQAEHSKFIEEQEALDSQAREGNPAVLDNFIKISGDGFPKLMPAAMERWIAMDPQSYNHVMSKVVVNTLKDGGVVNDLTMAFTMLGLKNPTATEKAIESLKKVAAWANSVNRMAMTPPKAPTIDPSIKNQQEELVTKQTQFFNKEFSSTFGSWRNNRIGDEVKVVSGGKALTDYQMKTLGERIVSDMQAILTSDSEYMTKLQKLYDSRNMPELLKFTKSRTDKILQEVTKKAYRNLFSDPSKKPGVKPNGAKPHGLAEPVVKGWTRIDPSKAPNPNDIDGRLTDFNMKFKQQAILKNGKKVFWGKNIPTA